MAKLSSKGSVCLRAKHSCVGLRREESCTFAKPHFPLPALLLRSSGDGWVGAGHPLIDRGGKSGPLIP